MGLGSAQQRHLVAAYTMVRHKLQQIEDQAACGRSPTGLGPPLSPLPRHLEEPVPGPLRQLCQEPRGAAATELGERLNAPLARSRQALAGHSHGVPPA